MKNMKYLDVLKEKLKSYKIAESNLEERALLMIQYADANNFDVMEIMDGSIDFSKLEETVIRDLNRNKKYKTSIQGKSTGNLEPNKYIKRLFIS